jgi:hypothetical protein
LLKIIKKKTEFVGSKKDLELREGILRGFVKEEKIRRNAN